MHALIASVVSLCANIIVLVSGESSRRVTINLSWAYGYSPFGTALSVGIYNVVGHDIGTFAMSGSKNNDISFADKNCSVDLCERCFHGNRAVIALVALCLVLSVVSVAMNGLRAGAGNTSTNKTSGIACSAVAMIFAIMAVVVFSSNCLQLIINADAAAGYTWSYGPSWGLMIGVIVLQAYNIYANHAMPIADENVIMAPPADAGSSQNHQPVPQNEKDANTV